MNNYLSKVHSSRNTRAEVNNETICFNPAAGRQDNLSNPSELLLSSLEACFYMTVECFSTLIKVGIINNTLSPRSKGNRTIEFLQINKTYEPIF